jgi:predicted acyltransferase
MPPRQRFLALDVFRGLTICFMIIVNHPGDEGATFPWLLHAEWHGFTPTDLVFPSFLFAVGNALSFVMPGWENKTNQQVFSLVTKRAAVIFLLGFLMYWYPFFTYEGGHLAVSPFDHTRIMGVLQRIALCYWAAALMIYFLNTRSVFFISIFFLLFYWAVLYWFGDAGDPLSMTGNAGYYLDKWLMGEAHMYDGEGVPFVEYITFHCQCRDWLLRRRLFAKTRPQLPGSDPSLAHGNFVALYHLLLEYRDAHQ